MGAARERYFVERRNRHQVDVVDRTRSRGFDVVATCQWAEDAEKIVAALNAWEGRK